MKNIAFIGAGIMGRCMIRNLMKAGYELTVYDINKDAVQELAAEGAKPCDEVSACVKGQDIVITMVTSPAVVESLYFGDAGILNHADAGTYLIDMTTSRPSLAKKIYEAASEKGLHAMDAPVTGGEYGAREGVLSILAGGEEADFEACRDVLSAMGTNLTYEGEAGSGQHTKMGNQIILAGTLSGIAQAVAYAKAEGLDGARFIKSVSTGAAASTQLSQQGMHMFEGNYEAGFYIRHFVKDMKIAVQEAQAAGLCLEELESILKKYEWLMADGMEFSGMQAIVKYYAK